VAFNASKLPPSRQEKWSRPGRYRDRSPFLVRPEKEEKGGRVAVLLRREREGGAHLAKGQQRERKEVADEDHRDQQHQPRIAGCRLSERKEKRKGDRSGTAGGLLR